MGSIGSMGGTPEGRAAGLGAEVDPLSGTNLDESPAFGNVDAADWIPDH